MDDCKLNEKMAELCGFRNGRLGDGSDPSGYPYVVIVSEEYVNGPAVFLHLAGCCTGIIWNPIGDWQQVYKFVIPALRRGGCDVFLGFEDEDQVAWMTVEKRVPGESEGQCLADVRIGLPFDFEACPRFACEAALQAWEAWEKLEEAG